VTVIQAGPCYVIQKKTGDKDGYEALQLGFDPLSEAKVNKPLDGHFQASGRGGFRFLNEFKVDSSDEFELGQEVNVELFEVGDKVHITGTSKGRGFAGGIKRWGFKRGPETHGCTTHRAPGSIGTAATPSRVLKGKRMPGQMGHHQVTIKNLTVIDIRPEENLILVKGAVPGANNGLVLLRKSDY
jgi:large subunit ribosomal protein L3